MIRSVSMLLPGTGSARPATWLIFSIAIRKLPHVHNRTRDRRRRNHRRAHQQRAPGRTPLPSLEVAVRRGRADLASVHLVGIHREAHRAAGAAPVEARLDEDAIEPFPLRREA